MKTTTQKSQALPTGIVRQIWDSIPASERNAMLLNVDMLPSKSGMIRTMIKLSAKHLQSAFGQKHRVAIIGPANAGKSTLFNQFLQPKTETAKVSPVPGTTIRNQESDVGLFSIIDTPGADTIGPPGAEQKEMALRTAQDSDFIVILFDAMQGIKQTELDLYNNIQKLHKPFAVVLNKIDLVQKDQKVVVHQAARNLGLADEEIIPISAKNGSNLRQVVVAIALSEPRLVVALGQALPEYRWQLAWNTIGNAASISAVIGLTPLPFIDFIPLAITQSVMVLGIARIYQYKITLSRARELVLTFGLGFLGRTLFYQLSKFGGIPGWMLASAIAASTTVAMGYAASVWFERGERLSQGTIQRITTRQVNYFLSLLKNQGTRKPGQEKLRQHISDELGKSRYAERSDFLEQEIESS
jgi:GTPase